MNFFLFFFGWLILVFYAADLISWVQRLRTRRRVKRYFQLARKMGEPGTRG